MADPAAPTVPNAAGVPPVNGGNTTAAPSTPATADGSAIVVTGAQTKWAIHNTDGSAYFPSNNGPDSFLEVDDSADASIPDYPTEAGGFESYNKVIKAGTITLGLLKSGTVQQRQAFRNAIDTLYASFDLVNVLTPGRTYRGYNLTHVGASRSADKNASLVSLQLTFTQVRQTVQVAFSAVAPSSASASANVNGGAVQTQTVPPNQTPATPPQ